jgi:radical SAM protein with 4Fe4S-binding SPASM domain
MSLVVAREIAATQLQAGGDFDSVEFDFIGGEPLLAWSLIQNLVSFVHSKKWSIPYRFSMSSNGTLLNDEKKAWFDMHRCVYLSFSLDGTPSAHNTNRSNSYSQVARHIPWFLDRCQRFGHEARTKMTISPATLSDIAAGAAHLHDLGFARIDANVPYEDIWNGAPDLLEFGRQLDLIVHYYRARPHLRPPQLIALPIFTASLAEDFPRWCGAGGAMVCYDPKGKPHPCHRFLPMSTGKEYGGPVAFAKRSLEEGREVAGDCGRCPFLAACPSCLGLNWQIHGDVDSRTRWHCQFILLQIKATAKYQILTLGDRLVTLGDSQEKVRTLKWQLQRALDVYQLLAPD